MCGLRRSVGRSASGMCSAATRRWAATASCTAVWPQSASEDASDDAAADDVQLTSGAGPSSSEDAKDDEEPGVDENTGDNGESGPARQRRSSFGHRDPAPSDEILVPLLELCREGEITPEALERRSQAEAKNKDYVRRSLSRAVEWQ